jgi:predicted nucleic acid-binding protein
VIVVDTQVIAYWALPAPGSLSVAGVIEKDGSWVAPALWQSEFRNVLAGYLRRAALSADAAVSKMRLALEFIATETVEAERVLRLVADSPCSAYDLEFVALAQQLGVALVTNDRQILHSFPTVAISPAEFARPDPSASGA